MINTSNSQYHKRLRQDKLLVNAAKNDFNRTDFAGRANDMTGMPLNPAKAIDLMNARGSSVDSDDKDLLNNMFNERQVASQSEIKRKLSKMVSVKDTNGRMSNLKRSIGKELHSVEDEG